MVIKVLVENTATSERYGAEHGLSLYIETAGKKLLFDVGASGLFFENAKKLDADIKNVDYLIISHGHYDHGGGLEKFFLENKSAQVYIHNLAFESFYSARENGEMKYIGLAKGIKNEKKIVFTSNGLIIQKGIELFSGVYQKEDVGLLNNGLLVKKNEKLVNDAFLHEQNLIIKEDGKVLLLVGCAHNGIANILNHFYNLKGYMPDYVMGGFHLSAFFEKEPGQLKKTAEYLLKTKAMFYTGHCTGRGAYNYLKRVMKNNIEYLPSGRKLFL